MTPEIRRAARLSLIPGVTIAEAAKATRVPVAAIRKARKDPSIALSRDDLLLAALTANGSKDDGEVDAGMLGTIASWLDYVNHDGSTADGVRADLERLAAASIISFANGRFRLLVPWP